MHFWFPFYPPASITQLWERFRVWMLKETLQNSKWACWWSSCQQIRSLSLWLRRLMLKPLNKSIVQTHADAWRFSATIVEHYKILHKHASPLLQEGHVCVIFVRIRTQVEDSKLHCNRLLFCPCFSGGSIPTSLELRQSSSCWRGVSMAVSWPGPARATPGTLPSLLG